MKRALCPILLFITSHAVGQRVPSFTSTPILSISNVGSAPQNITASSAKTLAITGGEVKFKSKDRIGFHAVCVNTLDAELNKFQKSSMAMAGFNVTLFKLEGFSAKAYISQGFNMRQGIVHYPRRENVTFEGLVPIFSIAAGLEYKLNKHVNMFSRLRWIGGDITHLGNENFSYGQLVFHTGICCKISAGKKSS